MLFAAINLLAAEGGEGAAFNPVFPDSAGELIWGAIFLFLTWIVLRYVCLPPLLKVRQDRELQAQADYEAAAAAEAQAEQVRRDYEATISEARLQASRTVEEVRATADAERGRQVLAIEQEVASQRQAAMSELDSARSAALGQIAGDVADLTAAAASKVVQAPVDVADVRPVVDEVVHRSGGSK
jgi:F-type H+-transporting ATPase subunit b